MRVVFIHQNMPGQFKYLARKLAASDRNEVVFITKRNNVEIPGVRRIVYAPHREPNPNTHHYLIGTERGVIHGQQVLRELANLKSSGFRPDVIYAHPGWGEALYAKEIFPKTPLLNFFEFYYRSSGADVGFNPEEPVQMDDQCRIRTKNLVNLLSLEAADAGVSPTFWQYQQHPAEYLYKLSVIFDGIDTRTCAPDPSATLTLPNGRVLTRDDEVVTYVARGLEPYRGFPSFMRAVEILCRQRPNAQFVIVGADSVSYGKRLPEGQTWREKVLSEVDVDRSRVHFLGQVPYPTFLKILQVSSAHVYLTYPFVLSWSMLEAMSAGCLVIGSRTAPVQEAIEDGVNGRLVDFFDHADIAGRVREALENPGAFEAMRRNARETVLDRYELEKCLARQITLMKNLAAGFRPEPAPLPGKPGQPNFVKAD